MKFKIFLQFFLSLGYFLLAKVLFLSLDTILQYAPNSDIVRCV